MKGWPSGGRMAAGLGDASASCTHPAWRAGSDLARRRFQSTAIRDRVRVPQVARGHAPSGE